MKNKIKRIFQILFGILPIYKTKMTFCKLGIFQKLGVPYIINIENNGDENSVVSLFGYNHLNNQDNLGNEKNIIIENKLVENKCEGYVRMSCQFASSPKFIKKIKLFSNENNLKEVMEVIYKDSGGNMSRRAIDLMVHKDPYQFQSDILYLHFNEDFYIDGNTILKFKINSKTSMTVALYPIIANQSIRMKKYLIVKKIKEIFSSFINKFKN